MKQDLGPTDTAARPRRPYPNGWFGLAFSDEVKPGAVLRSRFMGEDVVLYRTRRGVLRAVDPYCPHLGAHLGHGGFVEGEDIVCPFHRFAFDTTGTCVRTGYGTPPPTKATLTQRVVREVNGLILTWHHADGIGPQWEIPASSSEFPRGARFTRILVDHPQEIMENTVDIGHLFYIHGVGDVTQLDPVEVDGPRLRYRFTGVKTDVPLIKPVRINVTAEVYGLGYIEVNFEVPRFGVRGRHFSTPTPIDPARVQYRWTTSLVADRAPRALSLLLNRLASPAAAADILRDLPIWENKAFVDRPRLAQGDGPIGPYRRWASQFYSASTDGRFDDPVSLPAISNSTSPTTHIARLNP